MTTDSVAATIAAVRSMQYEAAIAPTRTVDVGVESFAQILIAFAAIANAAPPHDALQRAKQARNDLAKWRKEVPAVWYGNPKIDAAIASLDELAALTPSAPAAEGKITGTITIDDVLEMVRNGSLPNDRLRASLATPPQAGQAEQATVMVCQIGDYAALPEREWATVIYNDKKVAECYSNEDAELVGAGLRALATRADAPRGEELTPWQLRAVKGVMANAEHDAGDFDDSDEDATSARDLYEGLRKLLRGVVTPPLAGQREDIDPSSRNFKEGMSVGQAEVSLLAALIREPKCDACGACNATEAESMCRPSGDSCPGCEWPIADLWKLTRPASDAAVTEDSFDAAVDAYRDVFDGSNHCAALRHALTAALATQQAGGSDA